MESDLIVEFNAGKNRRARHFFDTLDIDIGETLL